MFTRRERHTLTTQPQSTSTNEVVEQAFDLSALPPKMQRFVHLYVTGQYTQAKLAQLLEVHPNTILAWMKRSDVKNAIADMQDSTHEMVKADLKNLTVQASAKLRELINSPIDGVALQAVKDVLDRAGHKPKQEIKVDKTVTTVEEKFKQLIDSTIDAEFIEIDE